MGTRLNVVLTVGPKPLGFLWCHGAYDFSGNAHGQHAIRNLLAFRHQRSSGNNRAFANARPVQDDRSDANQRVVFDGAAMQTYLMAHRHPVANDQGERTINVQDAVVLYIRFLANVDLMYVAPDRYQRPDA